MLSTVDKLKTHLGITATTYDSVLTQIMGQVDAYIKKILVREVEEYEYIDDIYDGDREFIQLKDTNLSKSDFTFQYNKGDSETEDWETVPRTDYELYYDLGVIRMNTAYTGNRIFKINYTAGDDDVAEDLQMLLIRLSAKIYNKRKSEGTSNESLENISFGWNKLIAPEDKDVLENHKLKFFV